MFESSNKTIRLLLRNVMFSFAKFNPDIKWVFKCSKHVVAQLPQFSHNIEVGLDN